MAPVIKSKSKESKSSLEEIKEIINETKFSVNVLNLKNIIYNNLVKTAIINLDYIIVAGVTFYLTKYLYSENSEN
tara:strand:+ start:143 stop:367 length:225 start_codon:yes stop_codon:yes gene_type:complete